MIVCAITDRKTLAGDLPDFIRRVLGAGVNWLQIREKDLTGRELYDLCRTVRATPNPQGTRLLLNGRVDVALAAGFDGVHLPSDSLPIPSIRSIAPPGFQIGISCHSLEELSFAESSGADYAFYSPIFESRSKAGYGPALGASALRDACNSVKLSVLALGGVDFANAADCAEAGAAGVAGISLFQLSDELSATVHRLRETSP